VAAAGVAASLFPLGGLEAGAAAAFLPRESRQWATGLPPFPRWRPARPSFCPTAEVNGATIPAAKAGEDASLSRGRSAAVLLYLPSATASPYGAATWRARAAGQRCGESKLLVVLCRGGGGKLILALLR
jgi:hypothetical protein